MIEKIPRPSLLVNRNARTALGFSDDHWDDQAGLLIETPMAARNLAHQYSKIYGGVAPNASDLYGAAYISTAWRFLLELYAEGPNPFEKIALEALVKKKGTVDHILSKHIQTFFGSYPRQKKPLTKDIFDQKYDGAISREMALRHWILTRIAQSDPAFAPFGKLVQDTHHTSTQEARTWTFLERFDLTLPQSKPEGSTPLLTLKKPILAAPNSIKDQLRYILSRWGSLLGEWQYGMLGALDMIEEEQRPRFGGPGPSQGLGFDALDGIARFSKDDDWMPRVVLLAKNILVWLDQLSKKYGQSFRSLQDIPDEELDIMAARGFNTLWLIGLWERSPASRAIKQRMGNPEAAASAYSLFGYDISSELGGWSALENFRHRAEKRGIRLSSDMVPNHVGIDSDWVRHHPERLLSVSQCPYPGYTFFSDNLSESSDVDIRLEDHYWDKSDASVVFRRQDTKSGETHFIYHGNDGTSMPWNDTAQIDFLNPEAREAVIQDILHVARNFPVIRFDAAMVLARKHIRRLWFPAPGSGGAIPSRSEHALSDADFNTALPLEFWREVVDRVAAEGCGTLLLAEAFWMMESYFVRTLGMHRVYNSAFMNMLRDQKNNEYRSIIKETLAFDPRILERFVNFMNNPDEETALEQFGDDDRYFAACTLLCSLPGLPMIGHGQVEGFSEKYGMEYTKAYKDENTNDSLVQRHEREIFPLLKRRYLFAEATTFRFYDLLSDGSVNENVYAFSNAHAQERALILVNNAYEKAVGNIKHATPINIEGEKNQNEDLLTALLPGGKTDADWILLKNHVSGLWYIRSVANLQDKGLSVSIDGFGRQVFLEFRLEYESPDTLWSIVAAELNGAGVWDPDAALHEVCLRPVMGALDALLSAATLDGLSKSMTQGKIASWPKNRLVVGDALDLLRKQGGNFDADNGNVIESIQRHLASSSKLWRLFGCGFRKRMARRFESKTLDESRFLATWIVFSACCKGQWNSWGLDLWLHKNPAIDPAWIPSLKALMDLPELPSAIRSPKQSLAILFSNNRVCEACGVNSWDGVLWYTLEGWNIFARSTLLVQAVISGSRWRLGCLGRRWKKANSLADYQLNSLLNYSPSLTINKTRSRLRS